VRRSGSALLAGAAAAIGYVLVGRGVATLDLGIGRTFRALGPRSWQIRAEPDVVFDVISSPYLHRTPRALEEKLHVWERGEDMVLAAHYTPIRGRLRATTVETVRFSRPDRVDFRLVRGPVPYVVETFWLRERHETTLLEYEGELGTDLWRLGRRWGDLVARRWRVVVQESFAAVKAEAERRVAVGFEGRRPR